MKLNLDLLDSLTHSFYDIHFFFKGGYTFIKGILVLNVWIGGK